MQFIIKKNEMRIVIEYDSCWQTGFMGDNPDKPIDYSKKAKTNFHSDNGFIQKYKATTKTRGERRTPITDSTIMGILCRLIGDQRKLFQAIKDPNFYFADIKEAISWKLIDEKSHFEITFLTNKSDDRCAQSTWLGVISDDNPWFYSENSKKFWSVLFLDRNNILDFILDENLFYDNKDNLPDCRPTSLIARLNLITNVRTNEGEPWKSKDRKISENSMKLEKLYKEKSDLIEQCTKADKITEKYEKKIKKIDLQLLDLNKIVDDIAANEMDIKLHIVVQKLKNEFPECEFWDDGLLYPQRVYASALYLQAKRLILTGVSLDFLQESSVQNADEISIKGFSRNSKASGGFNGIRDWLNPMSGNRKKAVGSPCQIQKASGQLEIKLDIDTDKAIELKKLIDNAGVSTFYLGKKGLAYVSHIDVR